MSCINCDRALHSEIGNFSYTECWPSEIDGYGLCTESWPPMRQLSCDWAGMVLKYSACTVCLSPVVLPSLKTVKLTAVLDTVNKQYNVCQRHHTPALDSEQCSTPPIRRLHSIHWGLGVLGCALQAGLSADCGLSHQLWAPQSPRMKEGRKHAAISQT